MLFNTSLHKLFDYPVLSRPEHFDPGVSDLIVFHIGKRKIAPWYYTA